MNNIITANNIEENFENRRKLVCRFLTILFCHIFLFETEQLANFNYVYANYLFDLVKKQDIHIIHFMNKMTKVELAKIVEEYSNTIAMLVLEAQNYQIGKEMVICIRILDYFHRSNELNHRILRKEFINDAASNNLNLNIIATQYYNYKNKPNKPFLILEYPWLFTTEAKVDVLQVENVCSQNSQIMNQINQGIMGGNIMNLFNMQNVHLSITVRRDRILEDSLSKLSGQGKNLKKPLKVAFAGEAGVDAGGVKKEFFGLLTKELFNPQYAMFTVKNVSQSSNFRIDSYGSIISVSSASSTLS
jgi:hypothetical protein